MDIGKEQEVEGLSSIESGNSSFQEVLAHLNAAPHPKMQELFQLYAL
jgi:hypothetical protein